jgi:poly-gamma-glutamate capsule biosynthesis protein CapA/YwtB (metallophosphatase superfamily)
MKSECQITVCGDLCPTEDNKVYFESGDVLGLFNGLLDIFLHSDFVIGNLEFPLINKGSKIKKIGPNFKGKSSYIGIFKSANFKVLGMANNHIRDFGDKGVLNSIKVCQDAGISIVGAGENRSIAKRPLIKNVKGWKIGIVAFAEHEFNTATEVHAGANLFDIFYSYDDILSVREQCDYLIVLYHGGVEYYQYPSPILQKKCRKMVDSGADVVICQHSHCIGTIENYNEGTIIYGQGNTLFGYTEGDSEWNEGLVIKINLSEALQQKSNFEFICISANTTGGTDVMPSDQARLVLNNFFNRSKKIHEKGFLNESWIRFCNIYASRYLPSLLGFGKVTSYINRKLDNGFVRLVFSKQRLRQTMHFIRCEAHHEAIQTILEEFVGD